MLNDLASKAGSYEAQLATIRAHLVQCSGGQPGYLCLWTKRDRAHASYSTADLDQAAHYVIERANQGDDVYIRSNVQGEVDGTRAATVCALTVLSVDFDLKGPGHKHPNLPEDESDLDYVLELAGVPEPTKVLRTGGGLLALWFIEDPMPIDTEEDRTRAAGISRDFQALVKQAAASQGWHVDSTQDLVRACRIPGTWNWKPEYGEEGVPVTIHRESGRPISLQQVAALTDKAGKRRDPVRSVATTPGAVRRDPVMVSDKMPEFDAIYAGCDAIRQMADTIDGLPEPQWYALAGIVAFCRNGEEVFKQLSSGDRRYSASEAKAKFDQARDRSGPRRCESIQDSGGACGNCPFNGRIGSPIRFGYEAPALVQLVRGWAYIEALDAFVDLREIEGSVS